MIIKFSRKDLHMVVNAFKMNLRDRYMGSALGLFWAIINPLIFLGLYTFIFGFVFKAKVPGSETTLAYSIYLISGFEPGSIEGEVEFEIPIVQFFLGKGFKNRNTELPL